MTNEQAKEIARDVASDLVVRDIPQALRNHGVAVHTFSLIHVIGDELKDAIERYLIDKHVT